MPSPTKDNIMELFTFRPPNDDTKPKFEKIGDAIKAAAVAIMENCPPSAETTLAIRALQESRMWANCSIATNPPISEDLHVFIPRTPNIDWCEARHSKGCHEYYRKCRGPEECGIGDCSPKDRK